MSVGQMSSDQMARNPTEFLRRVSKKGYFHQQICEHVQNQFLTLWSDDSSRYLNGVTRDVILLKSCITVGRAAALAPRHSA